VGDVGRSCWPSSGVVTETTSEGAEVESPAELFRHLPEERARTVWNCGWFSLVDEASVFLSLVLVDSECPFGLAEVLLCTCGNGGGKVFYGRYWVRTRMAAFGTGSGGAFNAQRSEAPTPGICEFGAEPFAEHIRIGRLQRRERRTRNRCWSGRCALPW